MKEIPLYRGPVENRQIVAYAKVDDEDYERLNQWRWTWPNSDYPARPRPRFKNKETTGSRYIYMHNEVMGGLYVDHIDRDRLNNQRNNLRWATKAQNVQNMPRNSVNTSGVKGATWHARLKAWIAVVTVDGERHYYGGFPDIGEADKVLKAARARLMPFSQEALADPKTFAKGQCLCQIHFPRIGPKKDRDHAAMVARGGKPAGPRGRPRKAPTT